MSVTITFFGGPRDGELLAIPHEQAPMVWITGLIDWPMLAEMATSEIAPGMVLARPREIVYRRTGRLSKECAYIYAYEGIA